MANEDIQQFSLEELKDFRDKGETATRADAPARPVTADFWANARVTMPAGKQLISLRVDTDVLEWFRTQGKGHLVRMNAVLRTFMEAQKQAPR